jgi:hypothetical protein
MGAYGEVHSTFEVGPGSAVVQFYDIRASRKAIDASGRLSLPGAGPCIVEPYFEREDAPLIPQYLPGYQHPPMPPLAFPPPPFPLHIPYQPPPPAYQQTVPPDPVYQAPRYAQPVYAMPPQYAAPVQCPVAPPAGQPGAPQEPTHEQIEREISLLREKFKSES